MTVTNIPGLNASTTGGGTPVNDAQSNGVLFVSNGELMTDSGLTFDSSANKLTVGSQIAINNPTIYEENSPLVILGSSGPTPAISVECGMSDEPALSVLLSGTRTFMIRGDGSPDMSMRADTDSLMHIRPTGDTVGDPVTVVGYIKLYDSANTRAVYIPFFQ